MDEERLDALLDATLASGEVPSGAIAEEREEILRLLASASALRVAGREMDAELAEAMSVARARFERFLAATQAAAAPLARVPAPRPGLFGRLLGRGPFGAVAWSAAGLGLLVLGGFFARSVLFTGAETAQAFEPGDYVELEGVVLDASGADGRQGFTVASEFNDVKVDIAQDTSVTDAAAPADAASIAQGTSVTVAGIVDEAGHVVARSVAVSLKAQPRPRRITFKELRDRRPDLTGKVITFALSQDGQKGRVLLAATDGERFLVNVDGKSLAALLSLSTALGAQVIVAQDAGQARDLFRLSAVEAATATPAATVISTATAAPPAPSAAATTPARRTPGVEPKAPAARGGSARLTGVVTGRDANVVTVQTKDGPRQVVVSRDTRILLGDSGLLREHILSGAETVLGHVVSAAGALDKATGRLKADVLIVGPMAAR